MNFIKDNWFKVGFLLIAFAVFYYLVIFLPKQAQISQQIENQKTQVIQDAAAQKTLFDNQLACRNLFDKLRTEFNNVAGTYYDKIMNTCMVRYFDKNNLIQNSPVNDFEVAK